MPARKRAETPVGDQSETSPKETERDFSTPEGKKRLMEEASAEVEQLRVGGGAAEQAGRRLGVEVDAETQQALEEVRREAEEAKLELETELAKARQPERKETIRETREFRDREGRWLGTAILEFEPGTEVKGPFPQLDGQPAVCRRLVSCILQGEQAGQKTEINLLEVAKAGDTEVWIGTKRIKNYFSDEGIVTGPPLETSIDVASLLHELGHTDQVRQALFKALETFPHAGNVKFLKDPERIAEALAEIRKVFPEAADAIDRIDMRVLNKLIERWWDIGIEKSRLEREVWKLADEKDAFFREAILTSFAHGEGIERFMILLDAVPDRQRAVLMEQVGFQFLPNARPVKSDSESSLKKIALDGNVKPAEPLPREAVASYHTARDLVNALENASMSEVRAIDAQAGTLELELSIRIGGERRFTRFRIAPGPERIAIMLEQQAVKEAEAEGIRRQIDILAHESKIALADYQAQLKEAGVEALISLPRNVLERDATRRAFQWMRTIREKAGINLFAPVAVMESEHVPSQEEQGCASEVRRDLRDSNTLQGTESNAQLDLRQSLRTYGADAFRLKDPKNPGDLGIMPRPGSNRKGKGSVHRQA